MTNATASTSLGHDARTIGLVGLAHGASHFFHLLLPPLFPWLMAEFGYSYVELGTVVSVFFIVSGVGQMLAGFLVDKVGARPILFAALASFALAGLVAASAQNYAMLVAAAVLAGLGNAPFHPVDFTILNQRVSPQNMGHAFSVHGISGNVGWAAAPVFMAGITSWTGSWRIACFSGAVLALVVLAIVVHQRRWLDDRTHLSPQESKNIAVTAGENKENPFSFLALPAVWLCFAFFFFTTAGLSAVQSFASPALHSLYPQLSLAVTYWMVTGFMLCSALGMVGGRLFGGPGAAAGSGDCAFFAAGRGVVGLGGNGLVAWLFGLGGGRCGRFWSRPGRPFARYVDQASGAAWGHGPGVWHGVFGAGFGL